MEKLADVAQNRWFHHPAEHPAQVEHEAFGTWLKLKGKAAVRHRLKVLAEGYQHVPGSGQQQVALRPQSISGAATRRDVPGAWGRKAHSYNIEASAGFDKCPACKWRQSYTGRNGKVKPSSRIIDCKELYKKKTASEKGKLNLKDAGSSQAGSTQPASATKLGRGSK